MKLRRGLIVEVEFSDHAEATTRPIRFIVYGRIVSITLRHVAVDAWHYTRAGYKLDQNVTRFTIVRSAIHRITHRPRGAVLYDEKEG